MAFEKFMDFISKTKIGNNFAKGIATDWKDTPVMKHISRKSVKAGIDLVGNFLPLIVGTACAIGGVYGLETYFAVKFSQGVRDNLNKNKLLSDPQKDWYEFIGIELVDEEKFKKNNDKLKEKISDEYSVLASWKSLYDK